MRFEEKFHLNLQKTVSGILLERRCDLAGPEVSATNSGSFKLGQEKKRNHLLLIRFIPRKFPSCLTPDRFSLGSTQIFLPAPWARWVVVGIPKILKQPANILADSATPISLKPRPAWRRVLPSSEAPAVDRRGALFMPGGETRATH
eukprot:GHVT01015502.1.p1 GENE.GHVT01015502.1~~GHVT01015502.1.p1  ORF type:complete len:146 (-),score=8.74 GHVT01015502.1:673-1110(-)